MKIIFFFFLLFSLSKSHPILANSPSHANKSITNVLKSVTESTEPSPKIAGLSYQIYIGIGVGAAVFILALILFIYFKFCRRPPLSKKEEVPVVIVKAKRPDDEQERQQWIENHKNLEKNMSIQKFLKSKTRTNFNDFGSQITHLKSAPVSTVSEKAYLIFKWLKENDSTKKFSFGQSCQLAEEFQQYCQALEIESMVVKGFAKYDNIQSGFRFVEKNHAWNAFMFNGLWYYVDVAWAITKQKVSASADYWFMTPPNIFLETHYSEEFFLHKKCDMAEFEQMHANQLEYHILGLKSKNFAKSIVQCFSNPFFIEFTCVQSVNLDAIVVNQQGKRLKYMTLVQTEKCDNLYKYCVIFWIEKVEENAYTLRLVEKRKNNPIDLSKYSLEFLNDQFSNNLPKYNLKFDSNIALTSHQTLVLDCVLNYLNIEFMAPRSTSIIGILENLDQTKKVDVTKMGQTSFDGKKLMVFSILPNSNSLVTFLYSNDEKTYTEFVKFLVLKRSTNNELMNEMVKVDARGEDFYVFGPLDYYLKLNEVYTFKYYSENAQEINLCNAEGYLVQMEKISANLYKKEIKVDRPGALNVFVKKDNETTVLAFYQVGDYYSNKIDHTKSYRTLLN